MKFNLKNPLWKTNPQAAREGFEKELRESMNILCVDCCSPCVSIGVCDAFNILKEILGKEKEASEK